MLNRSRHCVCVTLASSFLFRESFERYAFQLRCSLNQLKKQEKMARWNRAKESKDIFELIFSSWSLDDFCLYLAFWNMEDAWKRMKETNKKKSMRFLCNHFVFKLIQKWELRKVHNQNLIFPLFQILGSRNREMFPHLYSANPSLPGMQPQPQDPVRAFFFLTLLHIDNKFVRRTMMMTILQYGQLRRAKVFFNFTAMKEPWTL